jgi:DNA-binding MarR family transcriptional regulator
MDEQTTGALLREVARLHSQAQRSQVACCGGTTSTQCSVLTELGHSGPVTLADLGRHLGLDKGWTSRVVEGLVTEGLVDKEPSPTDRRTVIVGLTPMGKRRYQELNETLNAQSGRVMSRIPAAGRAGVLRALELLQQALRSEVAGDPILIKLEEDL